jgi:hypothetical protein
VIPKLLIALFLMWAMDPALAAGRGYFGAWFGDLPESETAVRTGVIVKKVYAGMAAQRAGLKEGEIVTRINGSPAPDPPTAVELLAENAAGEKVRLTVIDRAGGESRSFDVFAIMGDKPTAEFAKLKKTWARCPSQGSLFCATPGKEPDHINEAGGHGAVTLAAWCLVALFAGSVLAFLVREIWRNKKGAG